jgi:chorismate-pyruvate lyase
VQQQRKPPSAVSAFDPLGAFFMAEASRPAGMEPLVPGALTPFQRGLLVVDGTVTTFLEAWALEPILVNRLWQRTSRLAAPDPWLAAPAGATVLDRAVLLTGAGSHQFFVFAESRILEERLPATMRRALEAGTEGLGQILLRSGLDSRREGLWYGRERGGSVPGAVAAVAASDFLVRTYRVTVGGRPLMVITERFPFGAEEASTGSAPSGS